MPKTAKPFKSLVGALNEMLDKIDAQLCDGLKDPVRMYLAGGLAVNYYCGTRFTEDVDATFSQRVLLPEVEELIVPYQRETGEDSFLYFDAQYNPLFGLMHEDFEQDAREWTGIGNKRRCVKLFVISPRDLVVSKIARLSEDDQRDILALAKTGLVTAEKVMVRAIEALSLYAGNTDHVEKSIHGVVEEIRQAQEYL